MSDIDAIFRKLILQYEEVKTGADPSEADALLTELINTIHEEAVEHWYSSSADC